MREASRSHKLRKAWKDCYRLAALDKGDEHYFVRSSGGTPLHLVDGWFEKDDGAKTGSQVGGINHGRCVQVLQGWRVGGGYLSWYFSKLGSTSEAV